MQSTTNIQPANPPKDPILAAVLSLILLGGVGQLYLGQQKKGIVLIVLCIALYCAALGWVVQLVGAYDAYVIGNKLKAGQPVGELEFFWGKASTHGGGHRMSHHRSR
jgi:TM2 domain-containing membrane protein YozV